MLTSYEKKYYQEKADQKENIFVCHTIKLNNRLLEISPPKLGRA